MMAGGRTISAEIRALDVAGQEARIAELDRLSRLRGLTTRESDLLVELLRRASWRQYMRGRRRSEQLQRAEARVAQLRECTA